MSKLYTPSQKMFLKTVELVKKNSQVELHIVIPPVHKDYYYYFQQDFEKTHLYQDWVNFIKSNSNSNIFVHDFSYPIYQKKGIINEEKFWNDGVHFNGNTVFVILNEIYKK